MLIRNATLWDGTGADPVHNAAIQVEGDIVRWSGPDADAPTDATGPIVDAGGRWVIPGLIDLHVHVTADATHPDFTRYIATTPAAEQALVGAQNARALLDAGFTTVRDMGGAGYANVAVKRAIDAGRLPGPRLLTAGWFLTVPGGHGDVQLNPEIQPAVPHVITGPDAARRAVREQVKRGADWIKLLVTGGVTTGGTALGASLWEEDEIRAAAGMARRLGKPLAAHCHGADGIVAAAEAGAATVEHGTMADGRAAEAMARHHTALVPTFCAAAGVIREAKAGRLPPTVAPQALAIEPRHAEAFRLARQAGVRIVSGSDTGVPGTVFGENAQELVHLVSHGLTPAEALLAATRDAANLLGWEGRAGTLRQGAWADLLLVEGDPLADVSVLTQRERIHLVVKNGQVAADRRPEK
jgi:imidazolonepropionase-like amidohydrolase